MLTFRQLKGNSSAITENITIKLHGHNLTMALYIQYIPSGKSDRWKDRRNDGRTDRQCQTNIPPPSVEDNQLR